MATTRIMPVHINRGKSMLQSISSRADYMMNPDKTDGGLLVSSYECDPASADVEFLIAKQQYQAITGRVPKHGKDVIAYHVRQAFYPGEVSPEEANRIGYKLAMQFTSGNHQFIVATHIDKAHVHNHILINSTTLDCTHKFNNYKDSADVLRDMSDRLCLENNLSVIAEPEEKGKTYAEWNAEKIGTSWKAKLKQTIDEVIPHCQDFEDLLRQIQEQGYEVKRGKYISFRAPGQKRFTRMKTPGAAYDEDAVRLRIEGNERQEGMPKLHSVVKKSSGPDVAFLIDIQKKLAEGKGAGYEQWAKLFNLKSMANAMLVLQENGILSTEALDEKISSVSAAFEEASDQLKETESKLRQIRDMKKHIISYGRTREVYAEYLRSGKSEEFFEAHRTEIGIHLAAKKAFDDTGTKKLPRLKDLERHLAELSAQQKQQYETYRECRSENQKWQAVRQNMDAALGRMEKEKHRGVSR